VAAPATAVDFKKDLRVDELEVDSPWLSAGWVSEVWVDEVMEVGPIGGIVMGGIAYPEKLPLR
jgi:hypothetical protein